ncbi:winged helix-turn-helix domain-containing protein [Streptomyces sp. NPDC000410]|uniref:winged helix-turn-helix domain-containing protein n=1 Tax=Streptomyces sp. NPDC000410 TaxID=3154254 RepID=UPI003331D52F
MGISTLQGGERQQEIADMRAVRERICSGELKAGQQMSTQSRLAQEFGVERGAVRQALRILQSEGLLANTAKGTPSRVAPAPDAARAAEAAPQPAAVALGPRLAEAFTAREVRIDALCLTAEFLMLAWASRCASLKPDPDCVLRAWKGWVWRRGTRCCSVTPRPICRRCAQRVSVSSATPATGANSMLCARPKSSSSSSRWSPCWMRRDDCGEACPTMFTVHARASRNHPVQFDRMAAYLMVRWTIIVIGSQIS